MDILTTNNFVAMAVYTDGSQLVATNAGELHEFAKKIGLSNDCFNNVPGNTYYFIPSGDIAILKALYHNVNVVSTTKLKDIKNPPPPPQKS
jgi:hypothetical protein